MRRLLVLCAVAVTVLAAFAALRANRVTTVSAAGTPGNLTLFQVQSTGGCPIQAAYTYCDQVPGGTGPTEVFFVNNISAVTKLAVSQVATPGLTPNFAPNCAATGPCDFAITANSCTGNLDANMQCEISVAFSPTALGLRAATISLTDAGGDTLAINIQGTGSNLAMSPPGDSCILPDNAYMYCKEPVGGASGAETFTLAAGAPETGLNVSLQAVPGLSSEFAAGDFTIATNNCPGALAAGANCQINVEFTPKEAGLRSAVLTATTSGGDTSSIYVAGNTNSGLVFDSVEPGSNTTTCARVNFFGFCNEPTAGTTATAAYTLTNTSGTQITGLTITPAVLDINTNPPPPPVNFTVMSTSCATTLAANASCTINVAFTPQATGLQQGSVTVTDTQGDVAAFNLSGVGDDFSMIIVPGKSSEVSVAQGGTATFMAQLNDDGVFGQEGEQVSLACPTNLPQFTNCSFTPCPITPVLSGNVPFSVVIVTSSSSVAAPEIPNPCNSAAANVAPGTRGPIGVLRVLNTQPNLVPQFPALLVILAFIGLTASALGLDAMGALRGRRLVVRRARVALALTVLSGALLTACGKKGTGTGTGSTATAIATTTMNVLASAVDSNGNPINAGRAMQITLDVIKGP